MIRKLISKTIIVLLCLGAIFLLAPKTNQQIADMVVKIECYQILDRGVMVLAGHGSGVIINSRGDILTNHHVVDGCDVLDIVSNETEFLFTLDKKDIIVSDSKDLAFLPNPKKIFTFNHARLGSKPSLGDFVIAIGNPLSFTNVMTKGYIAQYLVTEGNKGYLLNLQISPGNSGGGLFNFYGNLVGINTAVFSMPSPVVIYGFAIGVDDIKEFLKTIKR